MTTKITLSVPDDFYEKIGIYKERLNFSDIFRRAILAEIEKIEEKGLIIKELEVYLQQGQANPDTKEKIKKEEISRFTSKWGTPDYINPIDLPEPPYVRLNKKQRVTLSNNPDHPYFLHITNDRNSEEKLHLLDKAPNDFTGFEISDYFMTKGFTIVYKQPNVAELAKYMTHDNAKDARSLMEKMDPESTVLFAADKDDLILIV